MQTENLNQLLALSKLSETVSRAPELADIYELAPTSIIRYAAAKNVSTTLSFANNSVIGVIEDNGQGFDAAAIKVKNLFGILGMRERILSLNGNFKLVSVQGKGTKVIFSLPCNT